MQRFSVCVFLVAVAVLFVGGLSSAAGQGATKVGLYVGTYNATTERVELPADDAQWVQAGRVEFRLTSGGDVAIKVRGKQWPPNTTFDARVVPKDRPGVPGWDPYWDFDAQTFTVTTNAAGRGNLNCQLPLPSRAPSDGFAAIKVRVYDPASGAAFATDLHSLGL